MRKVESGSITGNDLFVTIESAKGVQLFPGGVSLNNILNQVPDKPVGSGWWNGDEPDATNHGSVCSREAGDYAVKNILKPLR